MNWLLYLLLVNLYLAVFYGFYVLILRRDTFHALNRGYLLACVGMAFLLPLVQSDWVRSWFLTEQIHQAVFAVYSPEILVSSTNTHPRALTWGNALAIFYLLGFITGLVRLGLKFSQLVRFLRNRNRQQRLAFSFFNILFVSKQIRHRSSIVAHEQTHARQLHSADILLIEIVQLFCWFNPVLWLYKKSLQMLHEYIADSHASKFEPTRAAYAMILFNEQFGVVPSPLIHSFFDESTLKQRVAMLLKEPSPRRALHKYGYLLPLFGGMIILSSATLVPKSLGKVENLIEKFEEKPLNQNLNQSSDGAIIDLSNALLSDQLRKDLVQNKPEEDIICLFPVEQTPEFKGGLDGLRKYLEENLKYPQTQGNVSGRVFVEFIVQKRGKLTNIRVVKGLAPAFDNEALRVIKNMPAWIPGRLMGKPVAVRYTLPIRFEIE
jgi:TonB family protein